jgi:hypothetical protein
VADVGLDSQGSNPAVDKTLVLLQAVQDRLDVNLASVREDRFLAKPIDQNARRDAPLKPFCALYSRSPFLASAYAFGIAALTEYAQISRAREGQAVCSFRRDVHDDARDGHIPCMYLVISFSPSLTFERGQRASIVTDAAIHEGDPRGHLQVLREGA